MSTTQDMVRRVTLHRWQGDALAHSGREQEARDAFHKALFVVDRALDDAGVSSDETSVSNIPDASTAADIADLLGMRGGILRRLGRPQDALKSYQRGAQIEGHQDLAATYNRANAIKLGLISGECTLSQVRRELYDLRTALERRLSIDERAVDDAWLWADLGDVRLLLFDEHGAASAYRAFAAKARTDSLPSTLSVLHEIVSALGAHGDGEAEQASASLRRVENLVGVEQAPRTAPVHVFLSYSHEDSEVARQVASSLRKTGFKIYDWQDTQQRGERFLARIEREMNRASAVLVLLSPNYLASPWCNLETELALLREWANASGSPSRPFVYVIEVEPTVYHEAGALRAYEWLDYATPHGRSQALSVLMERLGLASQSQGGVPAPVAPIRRVLVTFRDRQRELELLARELTTANGRHSWAIVAPPQLGKSWLLIRLAATLADQPPHWMIRLIDLREEPLDVQSNATSILARLLALEPATTPPRAFDDAAIQDMARTISEGARPYLCLLDSAELLTREVSAELRLYLGQIETFLRQISTNVRLAIVVASRRHREWKGLAPSPRFSQLALREFGPPTVEETLRDLASRIDANLDDRWLSDRGVQVHCLTEGLPGLLTRCLKWIEHHGLTELEHVSTRELVEQVVTPYVEEVFLSAESLFPMRRYHSPDQDRTLSLALQALSPYRLFTQSHLRYIIELQPELRALVELLGWSIEDLWTAISNTSLVKQPVEPWQELYPAIRRLVYRCYHGSNEAQVEANIKAIEFYDRWWGQPAGKEQGVVLVERLWHEAAYVRSAQPSKIEDTLLDSAIRLSQGISAPPSYSVEELRRYAADRISNDEEFQQLFKEMPGTLERLLEIVDSGADV